MPRNKNYTYWIGGQAMTDKIDILIKRARLRRQPEGLYEIGIAAGKIAAIDESISLEAKTVIDAQGSLVTESFVNPHMHLCKVFTLQRMDEASIKTYQDGGMGKAMNAIELAARVKEQYDESWIVPNVRRAVKWAAKFGNTHIRAFADVDPKARLEGVKGLIRAREEFKGIVDIQVVAFPQDGVVRDPGAAGLVREAMNLGADVVGGIPWIEYTNADAQKHIDEMFAIAQEYDKPISMLVDDAGDAGLRTLEMLALRTIEHGWHGRTLACHARAMQLYPKPYFQKLVALLKEARLGVVSDPQTGPLHARVKEMIEEGALVCLGQDDISDAYYPFGRNNMLEIAFLASHLLWMMTKDEMDKLYDMVTVDAARALGMEDFGLKVGAEANLVVLDQPNVLEALRHHKRPSHVISHGKLLDESVWRE
jgi:cytosine deaminase